ncbi:mobile mystery protein A [Paraburkholderia sp. J41]|uniref:mobile mystery protein A n=1 Tax=Paraburkholderia sp. J41 TaxID=2805433 RepID=UPI002AC33031|nr:mobile mystery protein A [Paraburkholderia sp. J41]
MDKRMRQLKLEQVQALTEAYGDLAKRRAPQRGWMKLIRETLGMTERQRASRAGISPSTLHKAEQAEAEGRITLQRLRRLADELDCELVYALVPRKPLSKVVEERAREIAMQEVSGVAHSMALENQRPTSSRLRKQVEQRMEELLRGPWSDLWR